MEEGSRRYLSRLAYVAVVVIFLLLIFATLGKAAILVLEHV